jgi:hypothetical protein
MPEIINHEEKRLVFPHSFGSFRPQLAGPVAFGPVVRSHIMAGAYVGRIPFTSRPGAIETRKDWGPKISSRPHLQ